MRRLRSLLFFVEISLSNFSFFVLKSLLVEIFSVFLKVGAIMDVFNAFNKISREKLFPFKKILEIKKGDIFRVYSLRSQSSPWGPKIDYENKSLRLLGVSMV